MSGWRVWWYFVAFFGFIVLVNAAMITMAIRTHSGIVTDHPYEKGLAYNQVVKAERAQEALGWKSTLKLMNGKLRFILTDASGQPLTPDHATAYFTRPTQQGMDFSVSLAGEETPVDFPAPGLWEVHVEASYRHVDYQQSKRLVVP